MLRESTADDAPDQKKKSKKAKTKKHEKPETEAAAKVKRQVNVRPEIPPVYAERLDLLRTEMKSKKLDGYLVKDRMDQFWLTGFTGEDGFVLVTPKDLVLLTDGRFDETANLEAPFARKVVRKKRGPEATAKALKKARVERLGFEPAHLTVGEYAGLKKEAKSTKLTAVAGMISKPRQLKSEAELAQIRRAIRIAEQAFQQLRNWIKVGMTERDVAARLVFEMHQLGAQAAAFIPIVAVGSNAALPHYEPGETAVNDRDLVLIDWGARAGWYVSDLTRVLAPANLAEDLQKLVGIVKEAHDRAIAVIKPGVKASVVDKAAREHIEQSGFEKQFTHSVGHGIGLAVHEGPGLRRKADEVLQPGMVVTIEPGIYLPGRGGVRLENDVLVTESGAEVLSSLPAEFPPFC